MTIWYLCKYASPERFGGTRHFYLGEQWVKMGHNVTIFTANSHYKKGHLQSFRGRFKIEAINGINTVWVNTYNAKKAGGFERIKSWLHFEWQLCKIPKGNIPTPDVIIVSSLSLLTVVNGYRFSKRFGAKLIFEVRDIWPLSAIELGSYSKYNPFIFLLSQIERFGYKKANAIVGTMPNLKEHVENVIGETNKCYCIPQGFSLESFKNSESLEQDYIDKYVPKDKFIVAYAGSLNVNNSLDTLIKAAHSLRNDVKINFLIVGRGYLLQHWIEMCKNLENVKFAPFVAHNKVQSLLSLVDVCYDSFDSKLAKFGLSRNKWIDYMAAGKPIICSYSGYQSMINESNSGKFVEFGDVEELASTIKSFSIMPKDDLTAMGDRAKDFILSTRKFKTLASKYEEIFNSR